MITLKKFIQDTLISIVEGVAGAQAATVSEAGIPSGIGVTSVDSNGTPYSVEVIQKVEFDVAVTVEQSRASGVEGEMTAEGSGKIMVLSGQVAATRKSTSEQEQISSTASRVKFSVPVLLPNKRALTKIFG